MADTDFLSDHTETESAMDDLALRVTEQAELLMSQEEEIACLKAALLHQQAKTSLQQQDGSQASQHDASQQQAARLGTLPTTAASRSLQLLTSICHRLLPSSDSDQSQNSPTLVSPRTSMFFDNPTFNRSQLYSQHDSDGASTVSSASQLHDDADNDSSEEDDPLEAALKKKYKNTGPKPHDDLTTDPLPNALADTLLTWFHSTYTTDEVKEKVTSAWCPSNCEGLKVVAINREIYKSLSKQEQAWDRPMKLICTNIVKSAQPLAIAWSQVTKAECLIQKLDPSNLEALVPLPDGSALNLTAIVNDLDLALQLIAMAWLQACIKCRKDLNYKMKGAAKELTDRNQPITSLLFGDQIKEDHAQAIKSSKLTNEFTKPLQKKKFKKFHKPSFGSFQNTSLVQPLLQQAPPRFPTEMGPRLGQPNIPFHKANKKHRKC